MWTKFTESKFTSLDTYTKVQTPASGWSEAHLMPGAHIEAAHGENSVVISYSNNKNLKSLYISTLIEYGVEKKSNPKWLYWALMYLAR